MKSGDLPTKSLAWAPGPCGVMLADNSSRLHPNATPYYLRTSSKHLQAWQCGQGQHFFVKHLVAVRAWYACDFDVLEVVQRGVHQVRWYELVQCGEHGLGASRILFLPVTQHVADLLALQIFLATAQVARDDRKLTIGGPTAEVFLGHIGQRPDHDVAAIIAHQFGRHALEFAAKKQVQKKRLQHVVAVVTQGNLGDLQLVGHPVQNAPAQATAQAAHGLAFGKHLLHDAVSVLVFNVKFHSQFFQVLGQDVRRKAGLFLVQVDGNQLEMDRCTGLQLEQDVEQAIAVLAARDAHHEAVAFLDHVVVDDGLADLAAQTLFKFVDFSFYFGLLPEFFLRRSGFPVDPDWTRAIFFVSHVHFDEFQLLCLDFLLICYFFFFPHSHPPPSGYWGQTPISLRRKAPYPAGQPKVGRIWALTPKTRGS